MRCGSWPTVSATNLLESSETTATDPVIAMTADLPILTRETADGVPLLLRASEIGGYSMSGPVGPIHPGEIHKDIAFAAWGLVELFDLADLPVLMGVALCSTMAEREHWTLLRRTVERCEERARESALAVPEPPVHMGMLIPAWARLPELTHEERPPAPLRVLRHMLQRSGWDLRSVDIDAHRGTARIEVRRIDGRHVTLDVRRGRAMVEREHVTMRMERVGAGGFPFKGRGKGLQVERIHSKFLGRTWHETPLDALRGLCSYLADNAPQALSAEQVRALMAPMLSTGDA